MSQHKLTSDNKMHTHSKGTWTDAPAMPWEHGDSAPQNTAAGSGSRPTKSKFPIETSAAENAHTQGRDVPGWLGSGKSSA